MTRQLMLTVGTISGWLLFIVFYLHQRDAMLQLAQSNIYVDHSTINPIPEQDVLEKMTEEDLEVFIHRYLSSPQTTCTGVERMGKITDGGWEVCLDARYAPDPKDCLVYSFGINDDFSFDDAMERFGCEVHSFDPSMTSTQDHLRGNAVHFHLEGVGGLDQTITPGKRPWHLYTIETFRKRLGHSVGQRRIDVLKMDVEGAEREALPRAFQDGSLADIPQICFEMHGSKNRAKNLKILAIMREAYHHNLRMYMTNRNIRCAFRGTTGVDRVKCHEVYMVNVSLARDQGWTTHP